MEAGAQRVQEEQRKIEKRRGGKLSFPTFLSAGRLLGVIVETLAGLTAQRQLAQHDDEAADDRQNEVDNEERKAAGGAHLIGEAPDVAQADCPAA